MKGYFILKNTVDSLLTDTSLRETPGVGACRFPVISYINYTCYKSDISLRQATNPFETVNGNLRSAYVVKDT